MEFSPLPQGISVVIPCLNEKVTIQRAVEEAWEGIHATGLPGEVIVADNGSDDGSQAIATRSGALVVPVEIRGYGAAVDAGIKSARYAYVVFGDADLSYPLRQIPLLIEPLKKGIADFVLGNRLNGQIQEGAMPSLNRFLGTPVLSTMIRWLHRLPTRDCNSGMRAFRQEFYPALGLICPGMEYASEMLVRVAKIGIRYTEVSIDFKKDARGRPPHLRRWRDGWRHLRFIVACAPTQIAVQLPLALSAVAYVAAFALSLIPYFNGGASVKYHTAFSLVALATPLVFFVVSIVLVKAAFLRAGRLTSPLIRRVSAWSETAVPFFVASGFLALLLIESIALFIQWRASGFGPLAQPSPLIRITIYGVSAAAVLSLDMGLGLIRLLPIAGVAHAGHATVPSSASKQLAG